MKRTLMLLLLWLSACTFDVPITQEQAIAVDPALLGRWELVTENEGDRPESLVVLQHSSNEYLVHHFDDSSALYFRAWTVDLEGFQVIQLEWLGDEDGPTERDEKPFHLSRIDLDGDVLTVSQVNTQLISPDLDSSEALRAALLAHKDNPDLFHDPARFVRQAE